MLIEDYPFIKYLEVLNITRSRPTQINDPYELNIVSTYIFSNVQLELLKEDKPHLFL